MAINEDAYRRLTNISQLIGKFADRSAIRDLSKVLAEEARNQLSHEFAESRTPNGAPWKALAQQRRRNKKGLSKILEDSGRLKNSLYNGVRALANGFEIKTPVIYAAAQNYGHTYGARTRLTGRLGGHLGGFGLFAQSVGERVLPARQFIPERELGPIWGPAFKREAENFLRQLAKG